MSRKAAALIASVVGLTAASSVHAAVAGTSISVNFGSDQSNSALAPNEITGVVPTANWNNTVGPNGTLGGLVRDVNGVASPTGASVTWSSSGLWSTDQESNTSQFINPSDEKLMAGYLDAFSGAPAGVNFSGLPNGRYNVLVYSLTAVDGRDSGNIVINGVQQKATSLISNSFVLASGPGGTDNVGGTPGNYLLFPNVNVTDGTLNIFEPALTFRTAINGVELVQSVPEPTSFGFLAGGAAWLLGRRKRR